LGVRSGYRLVVLLLGRRVGLLRERVGTGRRRGRSAEERSMVE
jgi:hypothetical protein